MKHIIARLIAAFARLMGRTTPTPAPDAAAPLARRYQMFLSSCVTPGRQFQTLPPEVGHACQFKDLTLTVNHGYSGTVIAICREPGTGTEVRVVDPHESVYLVPITEQDRYRVHGTPIAELPEWLRTNRRLRRLPPDQRIVLVWPSPWDVRQFPGLDRSQEGGTDG